MGWLILAHIFSTLLMFMHIGRLSEQEKNLEILLLRHQLSILERKCNKQVRPTRVEKFTNVFDAIFKSEGINIILTPYRAPNANAYAERWVRTVRTECLDLILILNVAHLRRVLQVYIDDYYTVARPHQAANTNSTKTACHHWYYSTAKSIGRHH